MNLTTCDSVTCSFILNAALASVIIFSNLSLWLSSTSYPSHPLLMTFGRSCLRYQRILEENQIWACVTLSAASESSSSDSLAHAVISAMKSSISVMNLTKGNCVSLESRIISFAPIILVLSENGSTIMTLDFGFFSFSERASLIDSSSKLTSKMKFHFSDMLLIAIHATTPTAILIGQSFHIISTFSGKSGEFLDSAVCIFFWFIKWYCICLFLSKCMTIWLKAIALSIKAAVDFLEILAWNVDSAFLDEHPHSF